MKNKKLKGALLASLSAAQYGFTGVMGSSITDTGVGVFSFLGVMSLVGVPFLLLAALRKGEKIRFTEGSNRWRLLLLSAVGSVSTNALLMFGAKYMPSGTVTSLHYLYPLAVALIEALVFREEISRSILVTFVFCAAGLALFFESLTAQQAPGLLFVLPTILTWAFQLLYTERSELGKENDSTFLFHLALDQGLLFLGCAAVFETVDIAGPLRFPLRLLIIAFVSNVTAPYCLNKAIEIAGSPETAVFGVFEPIAAMIAGTLFRSQILGGRQLAACLLVLAGVAYYIAASNAEKRKVS